jgi:hypothetical protein
MGLDHSARAYFLQQVAWFFGTGDIQLELIINYTPSEQDLSVPEVTVDVCDLLAVIDVWGGLLIHFCINPRNNVISTPIERHK